VLRLLEALVLHLRCGRSERLKYSASAVVSLHELKNLKQYNERWREMQGKGAKSIDSPLILSDIWFTYL
jgi:hypothetical protein